jgi:hypothetical protein
MNYRSPCCLFFLFMTVIQPISFSQSIVPSNSNKFSKELHQVVRHAADSSLLVQQNHVDSLSRVLDESLHQQTLLLKALADSLVESAHDHLDPSRIDSAYQLHRKFSSNLSIHGLTQQNVLRSQLSEYEKEISDLKNIHEACADCAETEDVVKELSLFMDQADSSSEVFFASLADCFDDAAGSLSDATETLRDSLITYVATLIDNRDAELDSLETHSNKFIISMNANSISCFHGHDGGLSQAVMSPLISFRHSSGIKLTLGMSWLEQQSNHWDGTSLGLSYEFTFSPGFGGSIGYTHLWFDSSSTQIQSVFNQNISGEVDLSTLVADFSLAAEVNFNHQSEYDVEFTATHYWQFGRNVTLAPTLRISWGEQNLTLIAHQLQKIQKRNPVTKKGTSKDIITSTINQSNIFSILDYEIAVPLSIRVGRFVVTPSIAAIFPLAVFDGSRELPFLNAELTATIDWIW